MQYLATSVRSFILSLDYSGLFTISMNSSIKGVSLLHDLYASKISLGDTSSLQSYQHSNSVML